MTNEQAIELLEKHKKEYTDYLKAYCCYNAHDTVKPIMDWADAIDIAIAALHKETVVCEEAAIRYYKGWQGLKESFKDNR